MNQTILAVSLFFHTVATVVWIGGLLLTLILVYPEVQRVLKDQPTLYPLLNRLRKRFTTFSNLALVVLVVTGMFQMSADSNYDGVMQITNEWSRIILLKHLVIFGMVICSVGIQFMLTPALERLSFLIERGKADAQAQAEVARLRRREVILTWVNAGLGVLVLALSTWAITL